MSLYYSTRPREDVGRPRHDAVRGRREYADLYSSHRSVCGDPLAALGRVAFDRTPMTPWVDRLVARGGFLLGADGAVPATPSDALPSAQGGVLLSVEAEVSPSPADDRSSMQEAVRRGANAARSAGLSVERLLAQGGVLLGPARQVPAEPEAPSTAERHMRSYADTSRVAAADDLLSNTDPATDDLDNALDVFAAAVDALREVDLTRLSDVQVEDGLRRFVVETRRLPSVRHGLVSEVVDRCLMGGRFSGQ